MDARRFLTSRFVRAMVHSRRRDALRRIAELRRKSSGERHRVEYFHQVDDPYSHLAVQVLTRFCEGYDVELVPHLVGPPPDDAAAERELLVSYSRRDAAAIAPHYGLEFIDGGRQPRTADVKLAQALLANALDPASFASRALAVGTALWSDDPGTALAALARAQAPAAESLAEQQVHEGTQRRRKLRHYLGAMFWYAGEWYWGIDRLHHLERRMIELGAARRPGEGPMFPTPQPQKLLQKREPRADETLTLEYYPSLRSPYTAISMRRTFELAERTGVKLVLRPVMPMVMRGVPVPMAKGLYIMRDTKREAELANVPFGRICDPIGRPVERGFSLYPFARENGREREFLLAFVELAWAEGVDVGSDAGLERVVERAGLDWSEAKKVVDNEDWRAELEANRLAMYEMGVWGVPSFRVHGPDGSEDLVAWGQDRLWLVELEIQRRLAARVGDGAPKAS